MADMDSITLINTLDQEDGMYLSATLGPKGHLCTREELTEMCMNAIRSIQNGEGRDIDLNY